MVSGLADHSVNRTEEILQTEIKAEVGLDAFLFVVLVEALKLHEDVFGLHLEVIAPLSAESTTIERNGSPALAADYSFSIEKS